MEKLKVQLIFITISKKTRILFRVAAITKSRSGYKGLVITQKSRSRLGLKSG